MVGAEPLALERCLCQGALALGQRQSRGRTCAARPEAEWRPGGNAAKQLDAEGDGRARQRETVEDRGDRPAVRSAGKTVKIGRKRDDAARRVGDRLPERLVDRHGERAALRDPSSRACIRSAGRRSCT